MKAYQIGIGAALRNAMDEKTRPVNRNESLADVAIALLEETVNHLKNVHDGPGFFTGKRRKCRRHKCKKESKCYQPEDDNVCTCTPLNEHESSVYNDCPDFQTAMEEYLKKKICTGIKNVMHPRKGVLTQNSSERVGMVALIYRDKVTPLGPTHYMMETDFAIAHVNSTVLARVKAELLLEDGTVDARLIRWDGGYRKLLMISLGMEPSPTTLKAWAVELRYRSKHSVKRQTQEFTKGRAASRKRLKERRNAERKDRGATYKEGVSGDAPTAPDPGFCECKGACATSKCRCRVAGRMCGPNCRSCLAKCQRRPGAAANAPARAGAQCEAPQDIGAPLVGQTIEFHWPRYGWLRGEVVDYFDGEDEEVTADGTAATHAVQYPGDAEPSCHVLDLEDYNPSVNAAKGCWHVWRADLVASGSGAATARPAAP